MSARDRVPSRGSVVGVRVSGDVMEGAPTVVIPLSRAVVCGEDHVYDSYRFAICPNCAAEDRLQLADLLDHRRLTAVAY